MADIVIERLSKDYDGRSVLRDVSLRFPEARTSCLMAPSGAGKTTLLRLLMGLERPNRGGVSGLEGVRLAAVFQEDRLLDGLDPVENIRLVSPKLTRRDAADALGRFGLADCADTPCGKLSGGMRRRVALLRALLSDGEALLLDEPFNGLDAATRASVAREARRLINGRTAIVVTHDPEDATLLGAAIFELKQGTHTARRGDI